MRTSHSFMVKQIKLMILSLRSAVAELFNSDFLQATNSVAQINDSDYGQDLENHLSIIAIHQHYRDINTSLSFDFHWTNSVQLKNCLKKIM